MASQLQFLPASRGTLLRLREQLELVERGKNVLEMRRDQLVKEVFLLMDELRYRAHAEHEYLKAIRALDRIRSLRGEHDFISKTNLVKPPKLQTLLESVQGVPVPKVKVVEEPDFSRIIDPEYRKALETLWEALHEMIEIANKEMAVERLCRQLQYINRVVNSLDKNLIPQLREAINRIEEKVSEEEIEEFVRIKMTGEK
ncbi:MAG TPA: hypothetical protein ENG54_01265 [Thermofilum sp.]|nr:hypothetical protein [Thermofilum sp.]